MADPRTDALNEIYQSAASVFDQTGLDPAIVVTIMTTETDPTLRPISLGIGTGAPSGKGSSGQIIQVHNPAGQPSAFWGYDTGAEAAFALAAYLQGGPPSIKALEPLKGNANDFFNPTGPILASSYYVPTAGDPQSLSTLAYYQRWANTASTFPAVTGGPNTPPSSTPPPSTILGLWQIKSDDWSQFGGHDQLIDAAANARAAFSLFQANGFSYWKVFQDGSYANHLNTAQQICAGLTTPPAATNTPEATPVAPSGFNAAYPPIRQVANWTCSACSMAWMESSLGHPTTENQAVTQLGANIIPNVGLADSTGAGMASTLNGLGFSATASHPVTWATVVAAAGTKPVAIGGVGWNHWVAVTGYNGSQLTLANPSPGWGSVGDIMSESQFNNSGKGPFSMVTIAV